MRRPPTPSIVVDANIVLSAVLGQRTRRAMAAVSQQRNVVTTEKVADEVRSVAASMSARLAGASEMALVLIGAIDVRQGVDYGEGVEAAEATLRNAVASRSGSGRDAHVLALAWVLGADIWSHDRDFAGTGWPSWSSANLLAHLVSAELG